MSLNFKLLSTSLLLTSLAACNGGDDDGFTSTPYGCNEPATATATATVTIGECAISAGYTDFATITSLSNSDCSGYVINDDDGLELMTALETLNLDSSDLTYINLAKNIELINLDLSANELSCLDLSANTALTKIYAAENHLESINLSGLTKLTELYAEENQLKSIDLSGLTALETVYTYENYLESINLSGLTALDQLVAFDNKLTSINLSTNTALTDLQLNGNDFSVTDITDVADITALLNTSLSRFGISYDNLSADIITALDDLAQSKGISICYEENVDNCPD